MAHAPRVGGSGLNSFGEQLEQAAEEEEEEYWDADGAGHNVAREGDWGQQGATWVMQVEMSAAQLAEFQRYLAQRRAGDRVQRIMGGAAAAAAPAAHPQGAQQLQAGRAGAKRDATQAAPPPPPQRAPSGRGRHNRKPRGAAHAGGRDDGDQQGLGHMQQGLQARGWGAGPQEAHGLQQGPLGRGGWGTGFQQAAPHHDGPGGHGWGEGGQHTGSGFGLGGGFGQGGGFGAGGGFGQGTGFGRGGVFGPCGGFGHGSQPNLGRQGRGREQGPPGPGGYGGGRY